MFVHRVLPLALLLLLASLTWWLQIKVAPGIRQSAQPQRHDPDYIMENFEATTMNTQGNMEYRVTARKMAHFPDDDTTELERPLVTAYTDTVALWQVQAERGIARTRNDEVFLAGTVIATRLPTPEQGAVTIDTSNLTINHADNLGVTPDKVTITEAHGVTRATGMRIYLKEKRLELLSNVRGTYVTDE